MSAELYYTATTISLQVSCQSASSELADRSRFRYYFQMLATERVLAYGYFGVIREFGWKRVVILEQDENLFTVVSLN